MKKEQEISLPFKVSDKCTEAFCTERAIRTAVSTIVEAITKAAVEMGRENDPWLTIREEHPDLAKYFKKEHPEERLYYNSTSGTINLSPKLGE